MNLTSYIKSRNNLVDNFKESLKINEVEYLHGQLNMVSAALVNYLPSVNLTEHEEIYKNILLHKKLSVLEQSIPEVMGFVKMENLTPEILSQLKEKPTIICTFHTGSYRILNLFLTQNKIPFSLVIGKDVIEQEGARFLTQYNDLPGDNAADGFSIIDAGKSNVGLQMLRELKRGRSLVLYMDGNTGAGAATTKNDNRCVVNFLNQQLFARKGIAFLAHAANVPIITVASYRKSAEDIRIKFFDPIYPDLLQERNKFAEETTQHIYDSAASIIRIYPGQWEAWLYIHKVANIVNHSKIEKHNQKASEHSEKVSLDSYRFGIFKINDIPFLMKKTSYSFYQIDDKVYDVLNRCSATAIKMDSIDKLIFLQLYEHGVIQYQ